MYGVSKSEYKIIKILLHIKAINPLEPRAQTLQMVW